MIQRRQTLYLLLSAVAALLSYMFPFVTGKIMQNNILTDISLNAGTRFFILLLNGVSLILAGVTIFLYKNRRQQMMLCLLGILVSLGVIILFIMEMGKISKSTLALSSVLPFIVLAGFIISYGYIRKDEKLIKTLDKLR